MDHPLSERDRCRSFPLKCVGESSVVVVVLVVVGSVVVVDEVTDPRSNDVGKDTEQEERDSIQTVVHRLLDPFPNDALESVVVGVVGVVVVLLPPLVFVVLSALRVRRLLILA